MPDYSSLILLRDKFANSILHWRNPDDGLYRSSPFTSTDTPSYTNSGNVAEALANSGYLSQAQVLCEICHENYLTKGWTTFPREKVEAGSTDTHIMCNYWMLRGFISASPSLIMSFSPLYNWICEMQEKDSGGWPFSFNMPVVNPVFSSAAIHTLLDGVSVSQHNDFVGFPTDKAKIAIKKGYEFLLNTRIKILDHDDILMWPASSTSSEIPAFGTTLYTLECLSKYASYSNNLELAGKISKTISFFLEQINFESDKFIKKSKIWDLLHLNEGVVNYFFGTFAPYSVAVFLRHSSIFDGVPSMSLLNYIETISSWLVENTRDYRGLPGMPMSNQSTDVKIWSTAQGIMALTSIINNGPLVYFNSYDDDAQNVIMNIASICMPKEPSRRFKIIYLCIIYSALFLPLYYIAKYATPYLVENWGTLEPRIWLLQIAAPFIIAVLGIRFPMKKLIDNLSIEAYNFIFLKNKINEIRQLVEDDHDK